MGGFKGVALGASATPVEKNYIKQIYGGEELYQILNNSSYKVPQP